MTHPGESCRIVHVLDAVAPMVKVQGRSTAYPGFFGTTIPAGRGEHRLHDMALLVCGTFPEPTSGALSPHEAIVDMSGPAAPYCAFSDTANVVLVCHPASAATNAEFDAAMHRVKLKAAVYLARATSHLCPLHMETYELRQVDAALPRVVYIDQLHQQGLMAQTFLYGKHVQESNRLSSIPMRCSMAHWSMGTTANPGEPSRMRIVTTLWSGNSTGGTALI